MWTIYIKSFENYLMLERGLSPNSIQAYLDDVQKLSQWFVLEGKSLSPLDVKYKDLVNCINWLNDLGLSDKSQARIISGIRAFYKYLFLENEINDDPSELLEGPKLSRSIPEVLDVNEINTILEAIDLSHPQGHRNRAILETLYACGLRVSELVDLRLSHYFPDIGVLRVIGKGNKERLVPIGSTAIRYIDLYVKNDRKMLSRIAKNSENIIFLNRRGSKLTRVMIFLMIKQMVKDAGIDKKVSPHSFRHSFATHLIEGGADLKAVQDMLGHESITTTEIYTHLNTQYLRETILNYHPRNRHV